jgi:hypothetical protein
MANSKNKKELTWVSLTLGKHGNDTQLFDYTCPLVNMTWKEANAHGEQIAQAFIAAGYSVYDISCKEYKVSERFVRRECGKLKVRNIK